MNRMKRIGREKDQGIGGDNNPVNPTACSDGTISSMRKSIVLQIVFRMLLVFTCMNLFSVDIVKIKTDVLLHTSYARINGTEIPSNGLIYKVPDGVILIDTAWDDNQTKEIDDYVRGRLNSRILFCIITHAHGDRLGGTGYLRSNNIDVYMTEQTANLARKHGFPVGNKILDTDKDRFGKYGVDCYFPGAAHSEDNMVVYLKEPDVLFGGCLVKSVSSRDLGNLENANIESWKIVIEGMLSVFTNKSTIVIPGHGEPGGKELLAHTYGLLKKKQ
jgi:metallo-beta-lactamase class B